MIITLKDGSQKEYAEAKSIIDIAFDISEGLARELISKVQQMRKQNDYEMMDNIKIYVCADEDVKKAVDSFGDYIRKETLAVSITEKDGLEEFDLNGHKTGIGIERV